MATSFDIGRLRPSGSLLAAQIAVGAAIERGAVDGVAADSTVIDLLVRLEVAENHELRAVEICRQLLLSPSHISRVIDRAEQRGLVERCADPDDRRASLVVPTPAGRALAAEFLPRLDAVLERTIYSVLTSAEIEILIGLLDRIEDAARTFTIDDHLTDRDAGTEPGARSSRDAVPRARRVPVRRGAGRRSIDPST